MVMASALPLLLGTSFFTRECGLGVVLVESAQFGESTLVWREGPATPSLNALKLEPRSALRLRFLAMCLSALLEGVARSFSCFMSPRIKDLNAEQHLIS